MTIRECDVEHAEFYSPEEFQARQKTVGRPMYVIGQIVLPFLKLFGAKEHDYHGICKYYTIGKYWGGLEFGSYFICCEDYTDHILMHELGHGLQNANVGGWSMLFHWIGSGLRYWYRQVCTPSTKYDDWYYEGNATALGTEYVKRILEQNKEES